jgi:hypothetical protein
MVGKKHAFCLAQLRRGQNAPQAQMGRRFLQSQDAKESRCSCDGLNETLRTG